MVSVELTGWETMKLALWASSEEIRDGTMQEVEEERTKEEVASWSNFLNTCTGRERWKFRFNS